MVKVVRVVRVGRVVQVVQGVQVVHVVSVVQVVGAKISFNIILLNLAVRIIANFLLIDLFVFNL